MAAVGYETAAEGAAVLQMTRKGSALHKLGGCHGDGSCAVEHLRGW